MPSNPITPQEQYDILINRSLTPRDGSTTETYMAAAYILMPPATVDGPVKWRLFDAAYIQTGIIDPNRLGTGSTGAGNLYLADDGTWKPVSGGATTLDGLTDVTISAPANAQVLTYNSTTSQWENQTPSGGGGGGDMNKSTYDVDNDGVVDSAETIQIIVRNSTGSTLTKGQVVYLSGATGNRPNAVRAQADTEATSSKTFGIVVANIANNADGYVACNGTLHNLDTSAFTAGDAVWLSAATAGAYTSTIPVEPNHTVFIGYIARAHPTQGRLVILIQNGYELNELHGVLIASEANNDLLVYESSTSLWKNKTFSAIFGGTPLVSVPTLAQVTTAGNTTTNAINVGDVTSTGVIKSVVSSVTAQFTAYNPATNYPRAQFQVGQNASDQNVGLTVAPLFSSAGVQKPAFIQVSTNKNVLDSGQFSGYLIVDTNLFTIGTSKVDGTVAGGVPIAFSPAGVEAMRIPTSRNVLIGTTTDAGYKLDVNGTARVQGKLTISTGGTEITGTIVGYSGFQTYGTTQIFSGNPFQIFNAANNSKASFQYINAFGLALTTNSDAVSGVLKGLTLNSTLVAAANNDVLVGLDINPTFTNGAFTGVSNYALRVAFVANRHISFTQRPGYADYGRIQFTNITGGDIFSSGRIDLLPNDASFSVGLGNNLTSQKLAASTNWGAYSPTPSGFLVGANAGFAILSNNADVNIDSFVFAGPTGARHFFKVVQNNVPYFTIMPTGNVLINTTTDAGYKLDVNGVTRVSGTGTFNGQDAFVVRSSTQFIFRVNNDENIIIGRGGGQETYISAVNSGRLLIQNGVGSSQTLTGGIQIGTLANYTQATGTQIFTIINPVFNPTGYSDASFSAFVIAPTINQSANPSTVGVTRGLYINPTLVSPKDFRAIETTTGKIIFQGLSNTTTANVVYYDSSTGLLTYGAVPSGTVTSITAGTGLSGGTITSSGTIALANTAVTAGSYTLASITVDAQGRITAASSGSAGGTGTVTSVAMTVPTGLSISGSPITTSGTLAITLTAGYSIPTTASQTDWDTAYTNRITSLTTTGSSGAATLISNVLNIPNYTLTGLGGQPALSGTGFVKISGTTISYDNSTYYLASNPSGYTTNVGTVTSVSGTGTVSGLTLSGTVTSSGSLTLGGTLSLTSGDVTTALGFTPYNATNPAGYTTNTGTVTSVGLSSATSGVTIGATPITTSGTITLTIATAATAQNGLLSSTDWNTFNGKQAALSGTGFVKISGTTISYDNSTYYLASNPSGYTTNIGTVTSVSGTGTVSGLTLTGTVTTLGSLTLGGTLAVTASNFSSQTANTFLCAPNGAAGVPTFRAIVAADIPTLNQTTTGSAASLTTARTLTIGGTGKTFNGTADVSWTLAEIGAYASTNPSGYTTNTGTVTSIIASTGLTGGTITTSGTIALANTAVTAGAYTNADITVDAQGRITLAANGSAGTPSQWTTTGSDIYYNTGNVGIGTASPTDILHIVSGAAANIFGRISSTSANGTAAWVAQNDQTDNVVYRVFGSGASGTQMGIALARTASLIANLGGSGKFLIGTYSATDLVFGTSDTERMRLVDSTGNFLVGTTTDLGNKLEVSGTINSTGYKINNVAGYTGIVVIIGNPPGQQNIDIQSGIIVNVF